MGAVTQACDLGYGIAALQAEEKVGIPAEKRGFVPLDGGVPGRGDRNNCEMRPWRRTKPKMPWRAVASVL